MNFSRVLLKISGEAMQEGGVCYAQKSLDAVTDAILSIHQQGMQLSIVIGAGNILRGSRSSLQLKRTTLDHAGMLATVMNGMVLAENLTRLGCKTKVFSAFQVGHFIEPYSELKARNALDEGFVTFLTGGIASPFFTTDTTAALRASEIGADLLIKATNVKGIYSKDPNRHKDAVLYDKISFHEAIERKLGVMDLTAMDLCKKNNIPIKVIKFSEITRFFSGDQTGTLVTGV